MKILIILILFIIAFLLIKQLLHGILIVWRMVIMLRNGKFPCHKCHRWISGDFMTPIIFMPDKKKALICHRCKFELDQDEKFKRINFNEL